SYLQVAPELVKRAPVGRAYVGVGPEQNFTYIALTRPKIAFIVDIRRQNLVLHLYYRALFEAATSRAHFVALLLGRPYEAEGDRGAGASVDQVLAHATKRPPDEATYDTVLAHASRRAGELVHLDARDRRGLERVARAFFDGQLATRFSLKEKNGRVYPTIGELLRARDPSGEERGFLATEDAFRFVQQLERAGRVIPLVGDFAGDRAVPGVAAYLREHHLRLGVFYVSNVEQYLFEPKVWPSWSRNVAALPVDEESLFVRAYLDQGRRHPLQMPGHRTATVLQRVRDFDADEAKRRYGSYWSVATARFD
ncbi:MAG TPA: hypothetical protein VHB21_25425, partial [Minicystis sp.]|nr:hypothetical protein [Minicystis sp.]